MGWFDRFITPLFAPRPTVLTPLLPNADIGRHGVVRWDGWGNSTNRVGTVEDVATHARPVRANAITMDEVAVLMRRGLYPRLCDLRALWVWGSIDYEIADMEAEDAARVRTRLHDLGFFEAAREAHSMGLGYGVHALFVVVSSAGSNGEDDPATPLDPTKVRRVFNLVPIYARELRPIEVESNRANPRYGKPCLYQVTPRPVAGVTMAPYKVHASRLLEFNGVDVDPNNLAPATVEPWTGAPRPWADQIWDALQAVGQMYANLDATARKLVVHVLKVAASEVVASADLTMGDASITDDLADRASDIARQMGASRMAMLREGESLEALTANFGQLEHLILSMFHRLSMETNTPLVLLIGQTPSGLSTDSTSWWDQWEKQILADRQSRALPLMRRMVEIVCGELGITSNAWRIELGSLQEPDDKSAADVRRTHTEADIALFSAGVLSREELRSRYAGGGFNTSIVLDDEDEDELTMLLNNEAEVALELALGRIAAQDALDEDFRRTRYKVPESVANNARKVLEWREEHGGEVRGMQRTGWARARQLANEPTVTGQDLMEMAAWFARHGAQSATREVAPEFKREPWRDRGWVSWLGWGGDTARTWATEIVENARNADRAPKEQA